MLQVIVISVLIIAFSLLMLSVRLFFGKKFVHTHVDGNKALNKKGIHCAQSQDAEDRKDKDTAVSQHSKHIKK